MSMKKWHFSGFLFALISGIFLHFTYDWSAHNRIVGYFSVVNESIWEHLKLIFWPFVLWTAAEYFAYGKSEPDYFAVKSTSILASITFVVVFFYTYTGVLGFNLFALDIFAYFIGVFLEFVMSMRLMSAQMRGDFSDNIKGMIIIMLLALCFVLWTENPPDLGIFWG